LSCLFLTIKPILLSYLKSVLIRMEQAELKIFIKKIGSRIRELRTDKKMTQLDLAIVSNIDERQIQRLEASHTSPTIKTLYKISKALDIELYLLLKFTD